MAGQVARIREREERIVTAFWEATTETLPVPTGLEAPDCATNTVDSNEFEPSDTHSRIDASFDLLVDQHDDELRRLAD